MLTEKIKVAVNAIPLRSSLAGIGQYTYQLAKGLTDNNTLIPEFFYGSEWSSDLQVSQVSSANKLKYFATKFLPKPYSISRYLRQNRFDAGMERLKPDLYHEPNFISFESDKPTVITVHDLSWIRYPEFHPKERVSHMNRLFQPSLEKSAMVITDSDFIRQELIGLFGLSSDKVVSISLGVDSIFYPRLQKTTLSTLHRHSLFYGRFFSVVGTLEPRKNLQLALAAYKNLPHHIREQYPMVIIGMKGWGVSLIENEVADLISAGQVRLLGFVERGELASILASSTALIYPSLYEGFGLPPLEAMASGVPVIASNVSSIPEVVGSAGILIDPSDDGLMAEKMMELIENPLLRNQYVLSGLARCRNFTWSKCVDETVGVYHQILKS